MYPQVRVEGEALAALVTGEGPIGGVDGGHVVLQLCLGRQALAALKKERRQY